MKKKMLIALTLLLVIPGFLFFASCGKQTVKADVGEVSDKTSGQEPVSTDSASSSSSASGQDMISESSAPAIKSSETPAGPTAEEIMGMEKSEAMEKLVNEDVYFDFDSAILSEAAQEILKKKATYLKKYSDVCINVTIEGHCDERGTNEYNLALGERRAESAKNFLVNLGISPSRLKTISYGEENPLDAGHNEGAWTKNRRAHFVIK